MSTITTRAGKGSALTHTELDANFKQAAQAKTALYSVAESDNRDLIECDGTFAVTLPDAATVLAASDSGDFEVTIKNIGTGVITVDRATALDTIDGVAGDITLISNTSFILKVNQAGDGYNIASSKETNRGCLAYQSSNISIADPATFDTNDYDTDSIHSTSVNTERVTVPDGVTKVRVGFAIDMVGGTPNLILYKNGLSTDYPGKVSALPSGTNATEPAWTPIISVVAGDYFTVNVSTTAGITQIGGGTSWLSMEIIE